MAVGVDRNKPDDSEPSRARSDRDVGFEVLYAEEYEPMIRLAGVMLGSDDAAAEVVHDCFAKVFERWHRIDRAGAYLRTAVVNSCRDRHRRFRFRRRVVLPRTEDAVLECDHMLELLDRLAPRRRDALVLRFYLGLSEIEIAEALGVRPGTVKSLVSRGLSDLATSLAESKVEISGVSAATEGAR